MKTQIIKFHNTQLLGYQDDNGTIWVAVKPIAEGIGLDYIRAYKQITLHKILSRVLSIQTIHDTTNRRQEMLCLPLNFVNGWLFSIQIAKVKTEVQPILEAYQMECYDVLFQHFFKKWQVEAKPSRLVEIEQRLAQVLLLPFPDDDDDESTNTMRIPNEVQQRLIEVKGIKQEISHLSRKMKLIYKEIDDLL